MAKKKAVVDAPKGPPAALEAAMEKAPTGAKPEQLETLKKYVSEARDLSLSIADKEKVLDVERTSLLKLRTQTIPDYMNEVQVPAITVARDGNMPGFEARRVAFYSANIPAKWPDSQKKEAFEYLKNIGHDDLIKTEVTFAFPRGVTQKEIAAFIKSAKRIKVSTGRGKSKVELEIPPAEVSRGVNGRTLTKWLKNQVENEGFVPDLNKIGGFVGAVAELKILEE